MFEYELNFISFFVVVQGKGTACDGRLFCLEKLVNKEGCFSMNHISLEFE